MYIVGSMKYKRSPGSTVFYSTNYVIFSQCTKKKRYSYFHYAEWCPEATSVILIVSDEEYLIVI